MKDVEVATKRSKKAVPKKPTKKTAAVSAKATKKKPAAKPVKQKAVAKPMKEKPAAKPVKAKSAKPAVSTPRGPSVARAGKERRSRDTMPSPSAGQMAPAVEAGDGAPAFALSDQDGAVVSSNALGGQAYVLYFYPKDDTPGCTREACEFRDEHGKFERAGLRVIGVSPDKAESHVRFQEKYGLNFTLLSDPDKELAKAFGVWKMKKNYGREYMGIERSTFLVDANGRIRKVWRGVKVDGHAKAVLAALE